MTLQWSTDDRTLASEVRFGEAGHSLDRLAHGVSYEYRGAHHRRQHEVQLCDLEPEHTYDYEITTEGGASRRFHFVTAPARPEEIRVLVVGDARSNPRRWQQISRRALSHAPDVMMFSGDAVIHGSSQNRWDEFFESAESLFSRIPVVWADGNHEGASEVFNAQFALPDDGGLGGQEHWYALTYGPLRVIALNDTTAPLSHVRGEQTEFLRDTLAGIDRRRTPFVVSLHHQPLFTTSNEHVAYGPTRAAWRPVMEAGHLDLDIAGHVHSYESSYPMRGDSVVSPTQGTRYVNYGGAGASLYGFRDIERWVQKRERVHGYAILTVTRARMRWEAWRADGSLIERFDMTR